MKEEKSVLYNMMDHMCHFVTVWDVPGHKIREMGSRMLSSPTFKMSSLPFLQYRINLIKKGVNNDTHVIFEVSFNGKKMIVTGSVAFMFNPGSMYRGIASEVTFDADNMKSTVIISQPLLNTCIGSNNVMYIKVNGYFKMKEFSLSCKNLKLEEICRTRRADRDVKFMVGETEIAAHGSIISHNSQPLQAMFNNQFFGEGIRKVANLQNFDFKTVFLAVGLCYGERFAFDNSDSACITASNILVFADQFMIDWMKDSMEYYCIRRLTASNVSRVLANAYDRCPKLKEFCLAFIAAQNGNVTGLEELDPIIQNEIRDRLLPDEETSDDCQFVYQLELSE